MLIYFIRHGQTDWNKALRWQGVSDVPLNNTGLDQARLIKEYFVNQAITPSAVISSPLQRAFKTAQIIASGFDQKVIPEPAFRELNLGEFEGKTTDELHTEYGERFQTWLDKHHTEASPAGESLAQAITRMQATLLQHINTYSGPLLIVAHQAILIAMKSALSQEVSFKTLATYKQANFEVDLWDTQISEIVTRIDVRN